MVPRLKISILLVALMAAAFGSASQAKGPHRLPAGYKWGRCLLVVRGETRISGPCAYQIEKGGEFNIEGPRQIYDGIDYPKAEITANMISADYWATVFRDDDGSWTGYGNEDIQSVHGAGPNFGPLRREGACLVGKDVRVCVWKK